MLHTEMVELLKRFGAEIVLFTNECKTNRKKFSAILNEHTLSWSIVVSSEYKDIAIWLTQFLPGKYGCSMPLAWNALQNTDEIRVKSFIEDSTLKYWTTKTVYMEFGPDATLDLIPSLRACPKGYRDLLCRVTSDEAIQYGEKLMKNKVRPQTVINWLKKMGHLTGTAD